MRLVIEVYFYNNKKARVKLEDGFTFALYKGEIRKYKIKENEYISEEVLDELLNDILIKRAKERALYILKDSSKTKKQMIDKLKKDYYPDEIIERIITFLEKYNYVNDWDYANNYVEQNEKRKSIRRIKNDLYIKGISKEIVETVIGEKDISEEAAIIELIHKKIHRYDLHNRKEQRRFFALLQRSGFNYETIMRALQDIEEFG